MVVLSHGWPLKPQITVPRLHGQPIKLESLGQSIFKSPQMIPVPLSHPPFVLPSFAWFYIFISAGQVLLSTLSWCSACMSVSESVFLMYLWRGMYPMSTYSSIILFSLSPIVNGHRVLTNYEYVKRNASLSSPEKQSQCLRYCIWGLSLLWEITSHNYGGWKVPWSALYQL